MTDPSPELPGLLLPEGTRLVHIGPHKTGTTSLQAALWTARPALLAQGVRHVGATRNPARPAQAVTGRRSPYEAAKPPPMREWTLFARQVRGAREPRVVVSSEFLAHADRGVVERIVADLGPTRLHVAVTVRPLGSIVPSMWQQAVKGGLRLPLDAWTRRLFEQPEANGPAAFWRLHRHDALVRRWADVVGPGALTIIVVDQRQPGALLNAFESLLGLRPGTLALQPGRGNRSLTREEAEAIRQFNVACEAAGLDPELRARVMRFGAAEYMARLEPGAEDARLVLPIDAVDAVRAASEEIVAGLLASGVRIVGDPATLLEVPAGADDTGAEGVTPAVAARMAMGLIVASGSARRRADAPDADTEAAARDAEILADVPTLQVASALLTRSRVAAGHRRRFVIRAARRVGRRMALRSFRARAGRHGAHTASTVAPATTSAITPVVHADTGPATPTLVRTRTGEPVPAFAPGTLLLHIGPPKTGTTAIQASLFAARAETEHQGVHYAGRARHSIAAVQAVLERPGFRTEGPPPIGHWQRLVKEIDRSSARITVLSSEFFADGTPDRIRAALADLGADRVEVVVTLRPLAKILTSQWQQYVQSGARVGFERWLTAILADPPEDISPTFWRRHRDHELVTRWTDIVGIDHVTAIVLDERDHGMVLRAFEQLTGLTPGTLQLQDDLANRSLSLPEVEAVRALNAAFGNAGLRRPQHSAIVNFGATEFLKTIPADPAAPKVQLPGWALERTGAISREIVDGIAATGVRVIGDLERLAVVPDPATTPATPDMTHIPGVVAANLAMGILYSTDLATAPSGQAPRPAGSRRRRILPPPMAEPIEIARLPTRTLVRNLAGRVRPAGTKAGPSV